MTAKATADAAQPRLVDDDVVARRGAPAIEQILDADVDEARDLGVEVGPEQHQQAPAALEQAIELDGVGLGQRPIGAGQHGDVAVGGHAAIERDGARRLMIAAQLLGEIAVGLRLEAVDGRLAVAADEADCRRALVGDGEQRRVERRSPFHAFMRRRPPLDGRRVVVLGELVARDELRLIAPRRRR